MSPRTLRRRAEAATATWRAVRGALGARRTAAPGLLPPRLEVALGPAVPGAVVRLAAAALVVPVGVLAGAGGTGWALLAALALTLVVRPALPVGAGVVLVAGLALLAGPDLLAPPGTPGGVQVGGPQPGAAEQGGMPAPLRLALLAALLDVTVRAGALVPHVGWTSRVEWSVPAGICRAALRTQAVVQPLLWSAYGLRALGTGLPGAPGWRLAALVAVGGLLAVALTRRARPPGPAGP